MKNKIAKMVKPSVIKTLFNSPWFDFYFDWVAIAIENVDLFNAGGSRPIERLTNIVWRSKTTGRIKKKTYDYQID